MNFFPNMPNNNEMNMGMNDFMVNNDLFFRINELENKIRKLEQRIVRLENEKNNANYSEPDTSLYMI